MSTLVQTRSSLLGLGAGPGDLGLRGGVGRALRWRVRRWYEWVLILGVLDIMLTWCVMELGAEEANQVAAAVVRMFGPAGLLMTKAVGVIGFIAMCELVLRRKPTIARMMVFVAIGIGIVPVVVGLLTFMEVRWYATMPDYWAALWWGPTALR